MTNLDYTHERQLELERRESWKEGFIQGFTESYRITTLIRKVYIKIQKNKTIDQIAEELEEKRADIRPIYEVIMEKIPHVDITEVYRILEQRGQLKQ